MEEPDDPAGTEDDYGLVLKAPARRYAVTAPFKTPLDLSDGKPLVVQYEVTFQQGLQCGGAYVKLYESTSSFSPATVTPNTPYIIMFGPDRCGTTDKVHFILRWENPISKVWEEKHVGLPVNPPNDKLSHLYTLVIRPDDSYYIKIDDKVEKSGLLSADLVPPVEPATEIDDPTDSKPVDWVDEKEIPDASAVKPEDWDESAPAMIPDASAVKPSSWLDEEPLYVPDPKARKPEGWDEEEDGEWTAPTVPNPKCEAAAGCGKWEAPKVKNPAFKGKWVRPMIPNPAYKGEWKARQITNPNYFKPGRLSALNGARMGGMGVEVWTMQGGLLFDNFLVTQDEEQASAWAGETFFPKHRAQRRKAQDAERAEKMAELQNATVLEKIGYYVAEARQMAQDNPTGAITVAVVLVAVLAGTVYAFCSSVTDEYDEELKLSDERPSRTRAAPRVNAAGAEESDEEEDAAHGGAAPAAAPSAPAARRPSLSSRAVEAVKEAVASVSDLGSGMTPAADTPAAAGHGSKQEADGQQEQTETAAPAAAPEADATEGEEVSSAKPSSGKKDLRRRPRKD